QRALHAFPIDDGNPPAVVALDWPLQKRHAIAIGRDSDAANLPFGFEQHRADWILEALLRPDNARDSQSTGRAPIGKGDVIDHRAGRSTEHRHTREGAFERAVYIVGTRWAHADCHL